MGKFSLAQPPKTFKRPVLIDMHDGSQDQLIMDFKYRTRSEYGQFVDEVTDKLVKKIEKKIKPGKTADTKAADVDEKARNLTNMLALQDDMSAEYLLEIAEGWDLTDPFTVDKLKELKDKFPGAVEAIIEAYRVSILEGRLKN